MKKVIAFMSITACFLSCTSTKQNVQERMSVSDYYKNNPYAQPYLKKPYSKYLTTGQWVKIYVNAFKKHNYRVTRKYHLDIAWSTFDSSLLKTVLADDNIDSVVFLFAAFPRWHSVSKDSMRHPFIILEAIPKVVPTKTGNGGFFSEDAALSTSLYFLPKYICPPPNTGCSIPGQQ